MSHSEGLTHIANRFVPMFHVTRLLSPSVTKYQSLKSTGLTPALLDSVAKIPCETNLNPAR